MKIKKTLIRSTVLLMISFVVSIHIMNKDRDIHIQNIIDVMYSNNFLYVINKDMNDFDYDILKISEDNYVCGNIGVNSGSVSGINNEKINMPNEFIIDDKGSIYLHCVEKSAENGAIVSQNIYLCNFKKNKRKLVFSLETDHNQSDQKDFGFKISDNRLYYITYQSDTISLKCKDMNDQFSAIINYRSDYKDIMFIDFRILDNMTVVAYSSYGGIFIFNEKFPTGKLIYGTGNNDNSIVNFDTDNDGNIIFYDVNRDMPVCFRTPYEAPKSTRYPYSKYYNEQNGTRTKYSDYKKIEYSSVNDFAAVINILDDSSEAAVLVRSDTFKSYKNIKLGYKKLMTVTAACTAVIFAGLELLVMVFLFIGRECGAPLEKRRIKYVPVAARVIAFTAFVTFASGIVLNYKLKTIIIKQIEREKYESFLSIAQQIKRHIPEESEYYTEIKKLRDIVGNKNFEVDGKFYTGEYHCLHVLNKSTLYTVINEGAYENVPSIYVYSDSIEKRYRSVIDFETIIQHDSYGDWYIVIYKLGDNSFLEIGMEKYIVDYSTAVAVKKINLYTILFFSGIFIFFSVITVLYLFPLRRLSKNVRKADIINGSKGLEHKNNGNIFFGENEITRIAQSLDFMYRSIQRRKYEIEKNNKTYHKFICDRIFKIIGRNSVTDVIAGDSCKFECIILKFTFKDIMYEKIINLILSQIINAVNEYGGSLEYFTSEYVYSFFESDYKKAVDCAISAVQRVKKCSGAAIHIGISSGEALAAIIGGRSRNEGVIISKHKDIAGKLSHIGASLNCSIIATQSVCSHISWDTEKISKRLIGEINAEGMELPVSIYEIIDCNCTGALKKETIIQFEAGLKLLKNMKTDQARNDFVSVIRQNSTDLVAKYYYDKCENEKSETVI